MKPRPNAPYCSEKLDPVPNEEFSSLAILDAFFSNLIEGTRFKVSEAHEIVFDDKIPDARPADAHNVLGTFRLVGTVSTMTRSVRDFSGFSAFVDAIRSAHSEILAA